MRDMAVNKTQENAKLIIKVQVSEKETKQLTFSNLNPDAADDDVYAVGTAIAALQEYEIAEVKRQDLAKLADE